MGGDTCNQNIASRQFFFRLMADIRTTFPYVFSSGGSHKPHSQRYREFGQDWSMQKIVFEMADNKITKVAEVNGQYLTDFLVFLTYLIQKGEMEEEEEKFQQSLRDAKRRR